MTTAQNIVQFILSNRSLNLSPNQVHYGYTDLANVTDGHPGVHLDNFKSVPTYDTGGVAFREITFSVHVFATSLEEAEQVAQAINDEIELNRSLTPDTVAVYQGSYNVETLPLEQSYRFHVYLEYEPAETT